MRFPLPTHSYTLASLPASSGKLVNVYPEARPQDAKGQVRLKRVPGIAAWSTLAATGRGIHVMAGVLYAVAGTTLYSVASNGATTNLGTISGTAPVWMADNGTQLVIGTDGGDWYVYDGSLAAIADADFTSRGARACGFIDNYIAFVEPSSGRWFISDLADAEAYDALDFATAEGSPDNLVSLAVDHREVILFGEKTTERWYNAGATGFPLERSPGGFIEIGCAANKGVCKLDNSVFWLANDFTVRRLDGNTPVRVSTHAVEESLRAMTQAQVAACEAFSYTFNGHLCAVFSFATVCWVFDVTTGEWFERQTYGEDGWLISGIADAYGYIVAQDSATGSVGRFSSTTYTEFGEIQRPAWTYQPVYSDAKRVFHQSLEIVCDTGDGDGATLTLELSNDGGRTWLSLATALTRSLGEAGQYRTRVKFHRLGMARDRVYRASISDATPLTIVDTQLEAVAGD